jgi:hypothetical protein
MYTVDRLQKILNDIQEIEAIAQQNLQKLREASQVADNIRQENLKLVTEVERLQAVNAELLKVNTQERYTALLHKHAAMQQRGTASGEEEDELLDKLDGAYHASLGSFDEAEWSDGCRWYARCVAKWPKNT